MKSVVGLLMGVAMIASLAIADEFPTDKSEFAIDVASGQSVTITDIADYTTAKQSQGGITVNKTGEGTLIFNNTVNTYTIRINVSNGVVRLARSDNKECAHNVSISAGAKLIFDADNQVRDYAGISLYDDAVLDVNGHSDTMSFLRCYLSTSFTGTAQKVPSVINTSDTATTITVDYEAFIHGRIVGKVNLVSNRSSYLMAYGTGVFSSLTTTKKMEARSLYTAARIVLKERAGGWTASDYFALGDISFYNGDKLVPDSVVRSATASSSYEGRYPEWAADNDCSTWWNSAIGDAQPWLQIEFSTPQAITAYQLSTGASFVSRPISWDLYLRGDGDSSWILADSRTDAAESAYVRSFIYTAGKVLNLEEDNIFKVPFNNCTPLDVSGTLRVLPTEIAEAASLSGTGVVYVASDKTFKPGDISNWTGRFEAGSESVAHLQLDATAGGDEQRINTTKNSKWLSVENATETPMSMKIGEAGVTSVYGTMADGNGPISLVKEGLGEVLSEMKMACNTGATEIRSGTLCVVSSRTNASVTARYIRVRPLSIVGGPGYVDNYNYNWSIGAMWFLDANGTAISLSDATCTAETGANNYKAFTVADNSTRTIVKIGPDDNKSLLGWVKIQPTSAITFSKMKWQASTSEGTAARIPLCFQIEVSNDDVEWTTVCVAHSENQPDRKDSSGNPIVRGPFVLGALATVSCEGPGMIPAALVKTRADYGVGVKSLQAKYFRFNPRKTRKFANDDYCYGWEISEFDLYLNGQRITWPEDAIALADKTDEATRKLPVDNVTSGSSHEAVRYFRSYLPDHFTIKVNDPIEFDSYGFTSAGGNYWSERLPIDWEMSVSMDKTNWYTVEMKNAKLEISAAYTRQGPWSLTEGQKSLTSELTDALSDYAPLKILSGANVDLQSLYEKFGTLSGAGNLKMVADGMAEINALAGEQAAFSGSVKGDGTLVISGEGVQTLSGADLSGVKKLVLAGGRIEGTADFGGKNLTIEFTGGTLNAKLSGIGTLSIIGTPKVFVPAVKPSEEIEQELISANLIDAAAQAALAAPSYQVAPGARASYAKMTVTDKSAKVKVAAPGMIMLFR